MVFDNQGQAHDFTRKERYKRLTAVFTALGQSADDYLKEKCARVKNKDAYVLVSSDREIQDVARQYRIAFIGAAAFLEESN